MWCKVLKAGEAAGVRPMVWPGLEGEPVAGSGCLETQLPWPAPTGSAPDEAAPDQRLAQLEQECARREAQARERGFAEGQQAARKQFEAELQRVLEQVARSVKELAQERRRLHREAERDLVRLAVAIARKILRREIQLDAQVITGIAKAVLEKLELRDLLVVRAHPQDAPILAEYLKGLGAPERVQIVADRSLERGSVVAETTRGTLDGSVETQLSEIERGLVDLVERRRK